MTTLSTRSPSFGSLQRARPLACGVHTPTFAAVTLTAVTFAGTILAGAWFAATAALAVSAVAAVIDARTRRIPDQLVVVAAAAAVGGAAAIAAHHPTQAVAGAVLGTVAFAGPLFVSHLASPAAIGFGDVKLASPLGATLGLTDPRLGLLALCIATGTTAMIGLGTRRDSLPLGPALVLGAAGSLALARWVPA